MIWRAGYVGGVELDARRPANALPSVTSSAYSRSEPTGRPLARRVTVSSRRARAQLLGDVQRGRLAGRRRVGREHDLAHRQRPSPLRGLDARAAARRSSGPRGRCRRSARARRRARGRRRGTRACAPSGSRRWAPPRRRSRAWSRRGSWQMRQRGSSVRLKQTSHSPIFSLTSRIASASATASSAEARRMWKARRCAVRLPMPGQLRELGDQPLDGRRVGGAHRPRQAGPAEARRARPGRGRRWRRPSCAPRSSWAMRSASLTAASTMSREDLDVLGVDRRRVDLDRLDLAGRR